MPGGNIMSTRFGCFRCVDTKLPDCISPLTLGCRAASLDGEHRFVWSAQNTRAHVLELLAHANTRGQRNTL